MKRGVALFALAVLLGGGGYVAAISLCGAPGGCPCTGWLREEFALDDATCARVLRSQREFERACQAHCRDVAEARTALAALPATTAPTARDAAVRRVAEAERHCLAERIAQAHRIAAMLPETQRKKYLDLVLPRLRALDHDGPPGVAGSR